MYKVAPDPWVEPKRPKRQKQSKPNLEEQKLRKQASRKQPLPDQTSAIQPGEVA